MLVFFYNGISWFNTHFTLFKVQIEPFGKLSLELIYLASNGKLSLELVYLASNTLKSPSTCQKGLKNTFVTSNAFITHCLQYKWLIIPFLPCWTNINCIYVCLASSLRSSAIQLRKKILNYLPECNLVHQWSVKGQLIWLFCLFLFWKKEEFLIGFMSVSKEWKYWYYTGVWIKHCYIEYLIESRWFCGGITVFGKEITMQKV
jgi:hypothetical protein